MKPLVTACRALPNCQVEERGREIVVYFTGGKLVDGWVPWRGGLVSIPFRPWFCAGIYSSRDWTWDEALADVMAKYTRFWANEGCYPGPGGV